MGREFVRCVHDDASVTATRCQERPGFRALLAELRPGDDLLVGQIVALGTDVEGVISAIEMLAQRGVSLKILQTEFCITPGIAPVIIMLLQAIMKWFTECHQQATRNSLAWLRENGFVTKPVPGYGKRFLPLDGGLKTCRGTPTRIETWDSRECAQIREIRCRRLAGESYASIARDYWQRRERRSNGDLWARYLGRGKKRRIDVQRIRNADRFYMALRASGQDLEGFPVLPLVPQSAPAPGRIAMTPTAVLSG